MGREWVPEKVYLRGTAAAEALNSVLCRCKEKERIRLTKFTSVHFCTGSHVRMIQ